MKITLAVAALAATVAYTAGTVLEANTHALQVSRITGTSYLQVLIRPHLQAAFDLTNDDGPDDEELARASETERG